MKLRLEEERKELWSLKGSDKGREEVRGSEEGGWTEMGVANPNLILNRKLNA